MNDKRENRNKKRKAFCAILWTRISFFFSLLFQFRFFFLIYLFDRRLFFNCLTVSHFCCSFIWVQSNFIDILLVRLVDIPTYTDGKFKNISIHVEWSVPFDGIFLCLFSFQSVLYTGNEYVIGIFFKHELYCLTFLLPNL